MAGAVSSGYQGDARDGRIREQSLVDGTFDRRVAYLLLRMTLGVDFVGHGFIRLLHGDRVFAQGMVKQMAETPLPPWFVYGFGVVLPPIELVLGTLLVLGLMTRWALIAGSLLMMALMLGITLRQDWATAGTQLLYSVIFTGLLWQRAKYDGGWIRLLRRERP